MRRSDREVKDSLSIESLIRKCDVCRLGLADGNIPYIVTMNFGYSPGVPGRLWFHCAKEGRKIDMIRKNSYACFEMDTDHQLITGKEACDFTMNYSSVVGYGNIEIIEDDTTKTEGLNIIMSHYSDRKEFVFDPRVFGQTTILCLTITEISAKRKPNKI